MVGVALLLLGALSTGCRPPDGRALHKLACEQAAASLDLQAVGQIDALRKALGLAPDVDPIRTCKALGATMTPRPAPGP
jgi:ABC-type transporter Mla MlaB component